MSSPSFSSLDSYHFSTEHYLMKTKKQHKNTSKQICKVLTKYSNSCVIVLFETFVTLVTLDKVIHWGQQSWSVNPILKRFLTNYYNFFFFCYNTFHINVCFLLFGFICDPLFFAVIQFDDLTYNSRSPTCSALNTLVDTSFKLLSFCM